MQSALSTKQMCRLRVESGANGREGRARKCAAQSRQKVCSIYLYSPFGLRKICLPFCLPFLMCFAVLKWDWGVAEEGRQCQGSGGKEEYVVWFLCAALRGRCAACVCCFFLLLLLAMCAWVYALYPDATWPQVHFYNLHPGRSGTPSWSRSCAMVMAVVVASQVRFRAARRFVVNLQNACTD